MIVKTIPLIENASGMLRGTDYILKTIRGKTYLSRRPKPSSKPETVLQRSTRTKFKDATAFAKAAMDDSDRKAYYKKMAHKVKLPNAYTAALTDYMRNPTVETQVCSGKVTVQVLKKDFDITAVETNATNSDVVVMEATRKVGKRFYITVDKTAIRNTLSIVVHDNTGQSMNYDLGDFSDS